MYRCYDVVIVPNFREMYTYQVTYEVRLHLALTFHIFHVITVSLPDLYSL